MVIFQENGMDNSNSNPKRRDLHSLYINANWKDMKPTVLFSPQFLK